MTDCVFCRVSAGQEPCWLLYEDAGAMAFLDHAPVSRGHTLVIPRSHVRDVMAPGAAQALADVAQAVQETSRLLVSGLDADGISIFQSNGAASGQDVFHLHRGCPEFRGTSVAAPVIVRPRSRSHHDG